jgi:hypothetical protein
LGPTACAARAEIGGKTQPEHPACAETGEVIACDQSGTRSGQGRGGESCGRDQRPVHGADGQLDP